MVKNIHTMAAGELVLQVAWSSAAMQGLTYPNIFTCMPSRIVHFFTLLVLNVIKETFAQVHLPD